MGKLVVTIGVGDQQGRQFEDLEVTVDTGSQPSRPCPERCCRGWECQ